MKRRIHGIFIPVILITLFSLISSSAQNGVQLGDVFVPKENFLVYILVGNSAMSGRDEARDTVTHPNGWNYTMPNPDGGTTENPHVWVPAKSPLHIDVRSSGKGGPGMPFVKGMAEFYEPEYYIGVVQFSGSAWTSTRFRIGETEYELLIDQLFAMQDNVTFAGLISMFGLVEVQGSLSGCQSFLDNIEAMVEDFRSDLNMPDLPYIHSGYPQEAQGTYAPTTVNASTIIAFEPEIPGLISNSAVIPTDGLPVYEDSFLSHYDSTGCAGWAERVIDTIITRFAPAPIEPAFLFNPRSVFFSIAQADLGAALSKTVDITNKAPDVAVFQNVTAQADANWLDVVFADNDGNEQRLAVALNGNSASLGIGTYSATVTVNADNVNSRTIPVQLDISQYGANLALGKSAYASTSAGGNTPSDAVDGNLDTRWESAQEDNQWIYVDLEEECTLTRILIQWQNAASRIYAIQSSDDAENWTTVDSISDGSSGELREIILSGVTTRYIRIYGYTRTTGYGHSIYELEINGSTGSTGIHDLPAYGHKADAYFGGSQIHLGLDRSETVKIVPVMANGRSMGAIFNKILPAGNHDINLESRGTPNGLYFIEVSVGKEKFYKKVVRLR